MPMKRIPEKWLTQPCNFKYSGGTGIQWTWDYLASKNGKTEISRGETFNPWWGCTKVSPACALCYADTVAAAKTNIAGAAPTTQTLTGTMVNKSAVWGPNAPRHFLKQGTWDAPKSWNDRAQRDGRPIKVFAGSMCDIMEILHGNHPDKATMDAERQRLMRLIAATPNLQWLLLTKRPQNYMKKGFLPEPPGANVWLGTTAENQKFFDQRWAHLKNFTENIVFFSCEPLLGRITLPKDFLERKERAWVIVGGESGPMNKVRPYQLENWRHLRDQCQKAGVPVFHKQLGDKPTLNGVDCRKGKMGHDLTLWDKEDLVREFPV